jgi:hypothetical protein
MKKTLLSIALTAAFTALALFQISARADEIADCGATIVRIGAINGVPDQYFLAVGQRTTLLKHGAIPSKLMCVKETPKPTMATFLLDETTAPLFVIVNLLGGTMSVRPYAIAQMEGITTEYEGD